MASYVELSCDQGTDFKINLDLTNDDGSLMNIAGYSFASTMRKSYYSRAATANMTVSIVSAASGNVLLSMNSATTANIPSGRYLYDIKMTDSSNVKSRVIEGIITVFPQITR